MVGQEKYSITEEIFQQLTEDVSQFIWALSEWLDPTNDHSDTYLLLEILERRSRSKNFISELNSVLPNDKEYINKLTIILEKEEENYKRFLKDERIRDIVENSIPEVLNYLKSSFHEIIKVYEESFIYEEENTFDSELYGLEIDFLRAFTKIYHVKENVQDIATTADFCSEFKKIESAFRKKFYCFEPIADFLLHQKDILLPNEKEWWYLTEPDRFRKDLVAYCIDEEFEPDKRLAMEHHLSKCEECLIELEKIKDSSEIVAKMSSVFKQQDGQFEDCPDEEILGRYALDISALSHDEKNSIEKHVSVCSFCLDDIVSLRASAAMPRRIKFAEMPFGTKVPYKQRNFLSKVKGLKPFTKILDSLAEICESITMQTRLATMSGNNTSNTAEIKIDTMHNMQVSVDDNNQITLLPDEDVVELSELCRAFNRGEFYYKIFTFYKENDEEKIKEIGSGKDEYLPFKINRPYTNFFLVCLSKNENILNEQTSKLLNVINNKTEEKIDNIICLFVEIK